MGARRTFGREFKLEAVNLVRSRGVSVAQASRVWGATPTCCASGCVMRRSV